MNSAPSIISILLGIGSFLGFPYIPIATSDPTIALPKLQQQVSTSSVSFPSYAPLLPDVPATKNPSSKLQKLPTLALKTPIFKPIPLAKPSNPIPTKVVPLEPQLPQIPQNNSTETPGTVSTSPLPSSAPTPIANTLEEKARAAVVNIYCTSKSGSTMTIVTGSGIIIDPRGVILTNAHVADHILLQDYTNNPNSECIARKGSPASPYYEVAMLYISPEWLRLHGSFINSSYQPQETGAGDYALLAIVGSANSQSSLPQTFPYIALDISTNSLNARTPILAVAYPAGNLSSSSVIKNLQIRTGSLFIQDNYTFADGSTDLIKTNATSIAQSGSSGGGILNANGQLIGLIATTISDNNSSSLDLQAITLSYINRDLRHATGLDLAGFLNRDLSAIATNFKLNVAPGLASYLPH